jgi:hypothetical protein
MDATHIKTKFEKLGARAKIGQLRRLTANPLVIDIGHDRHGEFFDTHPDHATIRLDGWHRVEMNTENRSRAMASVAFLD